MSRKNYPSSLRRSRAREEITRDDPPWEEPADWYHWQYDPQADVTRWVGIVTGECPGDDEDNRYLTQAQHDRLMEDEDMFGPAWVEKP